MMILGEKILIDDFVQIARFEHKVEFSQQYIDRVRTSRQQLEILINQDCLMYGINTGFGALCNQLISKEQVNQLQKNLILSHAVSVGSSLSYEQARACMLMILQNLGQGYSGVRFEVLELIRQFLNHNLYPWLPQDGSVGYLAIEAHFALTLTGLGQLYDEGEWRPSQQVLEKYQLEPIVLAEKEGLALISGTTSATALAILALYDLKNSVKAADIIAAMSVESLNGIMSAYDPRVMQIRPHNDQQRVAKNLAKILENSQLTLAQPSATKLQDALSLRCIPQLHGAARSIIQHAISTIEVEINACCDNPVIIPSTDGQHSEVISACNADSSYVGMAMDATAIAMTNLAKMSERRNNRLIDGQLSGVSAFLVKQPGLNSGLMIPQYTQAALLNEMRMLSQPATIDNTPTCMNQEDYVAMGYNAAKKALQLVDKLEYILAIELLSNFYFNQFIPQPQLRSTATYQVSLALEKVIHNTEVDSYLYQYVNHIKDLIHTGQLVQWVENEVGTLD